METSSRLLTLLGLLQAPRAWTGPELARRLNVSGRTVRKDIDRLRGLGYPIEATRGAIGGYRLGPGADLPPLQFDDDEAVAIAIGLSAASDRGIAGLEEPSQRALGKLERVLPHRLRRRVEALRGFAVRVHTQSDRPAAEAETLQLLANACRDREMQRCHYRRHDGTPSRRMIEPHRLVNWGNRWYLVAWDDDRGGWRTFRVDRLSRVEPTGRRFPERELPDPDISAYVARSVARVGWRYQASVTVSADGDTIRSAIPDWFGTVTPINAESCLFETGADELWQLAVYLGALGAEFSVVGPPELVDHLHMLSARYARAVGNA